MITGKTVFEDCRVVFIKGKTPHYEWMSITIEDDDDKIIHTVLHRSYNP